ncbi:hypothetical protein [Cellulomonas sp. Y8]
MTETTNPTTTARRSLDRWLTMWNSDGDLAPRSAPRTSASTSP